MSEFTWFGKWKAFCEPKRARMLDETQPDPQYIEVYALAWRVVCSENTQSSARPKIERVQYMDHFGRVIDPSEIHWRELP